MLVLPSVVRNPAMGGVGQQDLLPKGLKYGVSQM